MGAVFGGRGTNGYLRCGAVMHAVVIGAVGHAAADSVDMLGDLIEGYFVHWSFPFLFFIIILKKSKIITEKTNVGLHYCRPASFPFCR